MRRLVKGSSVSYVDRPIGGCQGVCGSRLSLMGLPPSPGRVVKSPQWPPGLLRGAVAYGHMRMARFPGR